MNTRLALACLVPLAACVTSADPLDGLAPYNSDSGGGKFDDPNCTDASYRAFIKDYIAGRAQADATPCKSGNEASHRIWAYVVNLQLGPVFDAYTDAINNRANGGSAAAVVAAGTLSDDTASPRGRRICTSPRCSSRRVRSVR